MIDHNDLLTFPAPYAAQANPEYLYTSIAEYLSQAGRNWESGFEPLETLPAKWYNSLLNFLTKQAQATTNLCSSMYAELSNVIGTLNPAVNNQLLRKLEEMTELHIATASVLGGVKSSYSPWDVRVDDTTGVMSVNTEDASLVAKGIVQLYDDIDSTSTTLGATANAAQIAYDHYP